MKDKGAHTLLIDSSLTVMGYLHRFTDLIIVAAKKQTSNEKKDINGSKDKQF